MQMNEFKSGAPDLANGGEAAKSVSQGKPYIGSGLILSEVLEL